MIKVLDQKGRLHLFGPHTVFERTGTQVVAHVLAGLAVLHGVGDPHYHSITLAEYTSEAAAESAVMSLASAQPTEFVYLA